MSPKIEIEKTADFEFRVRIIERGSESIHYVSMKQDDYTRLTGGKIKPEELIKCSFEFLLKRETKESILGRFDLSIISRYFPEYEREIKKRLL